MPESKYNKKEYEISPFEIDEFWFQDTNSLFNAWDDFTLDKENKNKRRVFIDNGGKILMVAHLDTVLPSKIVQFKKDRVWAVGLDDRLGALIAFKLSKLLGADLLLTDNEEICNSTARYHTLKDRYNWIVEFDRAGDDVVTYDLESPEFIDALQDQFKIGIGTYSDICDLETDVCCFNMGIGYQHAHSKDSYASLTVLNKQIERFIEFYEVNQDTRFDFDGLDSTGYPNYFDKYLNKESGWLCDICGTEYGETIYDYTVCESCFELMMSNVYI